MKLALFDTETTGIDTENDRIITAFVGLMSEKGELEEKYSWVINPGFDIPEEASDVHGYTTERIQAEGRTDVWPALFEIMQRLDIYDRQGIPVVAYNAPFDFTMLDRNLRRFDFLTFRAPNVVFDPYVLDKAVDKYRKGKRRLVDTAAHYGVEVRDDAHDAEADCVMAGQIMLKLLEHPKIKPFTPEQIHAKTIKTKFNQAESFKEYLIKKGEDASDVSTEWPMIAYKGE